MKGIIAVGLALLAPAIAAAPAAAAVCTDQQDALTNYLPTHVNAGAEFELRIDSVAGPEYVSAVTITYNGQTQTVTPRPYASRAIALNAPDRLGRFIVSVRWEQVDWAKGLSPACSGNDDLTAVVVRRGVRIGDTYETHVGGRWRMTFTPMNYNAPADTAVWKTLPSCDIGACPLRAQSSGGARYRFSREGPTTYRFRSRLSEGPAADCRITQRHLDGSRTIERVRGAYLTQRETVFRVRGWTVDRQSLYLASRIEGVSRDFYVPTGRGRAHGCHRITQVTRLVGVPTSK